MSNNKTRYIFAYTVDGNDRVEEIGVYATSEEEARSLVEPAVRNWDDFLEEDATISVGELLKVEDPDSRYYECEGCSS